MSIVSENYNSKHIVVKGRLDTGLTTMADIGGCNILLNQGGLLATATKLDISSSSADDDSAGTGARSVTIYGLGADKKYQTETIAMDGTTIVTTVKTWYRVFIIKVEAYGDGLVNAGNIYAVKTGTGGTYSTPGVPGTFTIASAIVRMPATVCQGTTCFYTTPNITGGLWRVSSLDLSARTYAGTITIQVQDYGNAFAPRREFYSEFPAGLSVQLNLEKYNIVVGPDTDIRVLGAGASAGAIVHCGMVIECLTAISFE